MATKNRSKQARYGVAEDTEVSKSRQMTALRIAVGAGIEGTQSVAQKAWGRQVPKRFAAFDYDDIVDPESGVSPEVRRSLTGFMKSPSNFLILHGPTGTGKTTAACAVISELLDRYIETGDRLPGGAPKFFTFNNLQRSLSVMDRAQHSRQSVAEYTFAVACGTSILLIDDIGAGNDSATARQEKLVWDILNNRYNDPDKITVLTTNMPLSRSEEGATCLAEWLGESMWDRVSSEMVNVMFKGASRRGIDDDDGEDDE